MKSMLERLKLTVEELDQLEEALQEHNDKSMQALDRAIQQCFNSGRVHLLQEDWRVS